MVRFNSTAEIHFANNKSIVKLFFHTSTQIHSKVLFLLVLSEQWLLRDSDCWLEWLQLLNPGPGETAGQPPLPQLYPASIRHNAGTLTMASCSGQIHHSYTTVWLNGTIQEHKTILIALWFALISSSVYMRAVKNMCMFVFFYILNCEEVGAIPAI